MRADLKINVSHRPRPLNEPRGEAQNSTHGYGCTSVASLQARKLALMWDQGRARLSFRVIFLSLFKEMMINLVSIQSMTTRMTRMIVNVDFFFYRHQASFIFALFLNFEI